MKLTFLYAPVDDIGKALSFYRDTLGWSEAWREGDTTVAFDIPGAEVQLMIDKVESGMPAGPVFVVEDALRFYEERTGDLAFLFAPREIPGGVWTAFKDPAGNVVHVIDAPTD